MQTSFSKVLLFGEHTVVNGGQALAIPFSHFSGTWKFTTKDIDRNLSSFADYIDHHDSLYNIISVDRFFGDLDRGLIFDSNIPIGYGLGSSGALVAGVYKRYRTNVTNVNAAELKQQLADLESHFHGQSSGFDPLVCYLNKPILSENGRIQITESLNLNQGGYQLFLMNTHVARSTGPIVESFQEYIGHRQNRQHIMEVYTPYVEGAIESIQAGDLSKLFAQIESISGYQYAYLDFLIDEGSKAIWKDGLASDYFKIKICGAGKGGYLLGITNNMNLLKTTYPSREIITIQ